MCQSQWLPFSLNLGYSYLRDWKFYIQLAEFPLKFAGPAVSNVLFLSLPLSSFNLFTALSLKLLSAPFIFSFFVFYTLTFAFSRISQACRISAVSIFLFLLITYNLFSCTQLLMPSHNQSPVNQLISSRITEAPCICEQFLFWTKVGVPGPQGQVLSIAVVRN